MEGDRMDDSVCVCLQGEMMKEEVQGGRRRGEEGRPGMKCDKGCELL